MRVQVERDDGAPMVMRDSRYVQTIYPAVRQLVGLQSDKVALDLRAPQFVSLGACMLKNDDGSVRGCRGPPNLLAVTDQLDGRCVELKIRPQDPAYACGFADAYEAPAAMFAKKSSAGIVVEHEGVALSSPEL